MSGPHAQIFITVGPVSEFIGGGRRSRDLWYGSQWLSALVNQIANALNSASGPVSYEVLHPSRDRLEEAIVLFPEPHGKRFRARLQNKLLASASFANKKLSDPELHGILNDEMDRVASDVRNWYATELERIKDDSRWRMVIDSPSFDKQIDAIRDGDFIEFYAGWEICQSADDNQARRAAISLVTQARKNTRLFQKPVFSIDDRPKSDLDVGRDSILKEMNKGSESKRLNQVRLLAGVREGEQLDVIGFARRLAVYHTTDHSEILQVLPFPSLGRIAFDSYIRSAQLNDPRLEDEGFVIGRLEIDCHRAMAHHPAYLCTPVSSHP